MWVYREDEYNPGTYEVGYYVGGKWVSDCPPHPLYTPEEAAQRVHYLNGGFDGSGLAAALRKMRM